MPADGVGSEHDGDGIWATLRRRATQAAQLGRAGYSGLLVGAAGLLDSGEIVTGCNVENASYGLTLCAECGLVSLAAITGATARVTKVSVVDGWGGLLSPCGRCRQLLLEAGGPDLLVDSPTGPLRVDELLPVAFGAGSISKEDRRTVRVGLRLEAARVPQIDLEAIRRAPKVLLHDHIDGGLRPETVIELADEEGWRELPTDDPEQLAEWFIAGTTRGSLPLYLERFRYTVALMQKADALARVARESVEDLAADGIVYAELRLAPELNCTGGLSMDGVIEAVLDGIAQGCMATGIVAKLIVCAMRNSDRSLAAVDAAVRWMDRGVVGFDLAGPEEGFPPGLHLEACSRAWHHGLPVTIHAGEAAGFGSIAEALHPCGARRIGHGVRISQDIVSKDGGEVGLGDLARCVRDLAVALELCPTSNLQTGAVPPGSVHPIGMLSELGFAVTVNTDNRLMSGVTLSSELLWLVETFGWGWSDIQRVTVTALEAAFGDLPTRRRISKDIIAPSYGRLTSVAHA